MTVLSTKADDLSRALAPAVREMLLDEVRRLALAERDAKADQVEQEINEACRAVARCADRLCAARFSGAAEGSAHRKLVHAAMELGKTLRKHGRMPGGE